MFTVPTGKPGVLASYTAVPREVFSANRQFAQFVASPVTIDGTASGNPLNAPITGVLWAGTLMGRNTSTGKYANSVIGTITAAYAHGTSGTTVQTDVNTAAEIVRRIGAAGTFKLTAPPTAGGTVATQVITYSAINLTTGAITVTAGSADAVIGSFLQPVDGSEAVVSMLCDTWGVRIVDPITSNRVDVFDAKLLAGGGTVNVGSIVNYPADTSLKAWVKAGIRTACPAVNFSDDFA
jgi:hypothetical protein